ncbi:hypothetical protein BofuT4_uP031070.1 [Botrytis cinerea T4]|uniref:Uncharacterized protein n=1 Tax=Botryotinia fuckeliana (strain T4) TaxID=999810 RepID=G2Y9F5_BOTF4|nr:hypothetical protein BofuT4_uP031070.1 [Botrytis cinerea T4]
MSSATQQHQQNMCRSRPIEDTAILKRYSAEKKWATVDYW